MVFASTMRHDNDNDPISFISLAAATANAVRYLIRENEKSGDKERDGDRKPGKTSEKHPDSNSEYVDQRLRELAAFERRYVTDKKRRV